MKSIPLVEIFMNQKKYTVTFLRCENEWHADEFYDVIAFCIRDGRWGRGPRISRQSVSRAWANCVIVLWCREFEIYGILSMHCGIWADLMRFRIRPLSLSLYRALFLDCRTRGHKSTEPFVRRLLSTMSSQTSLKLAATRHGWKNLKFSSLQLQGCPLF